MTAGAADGLPDPATRHPRPEHRRVGFLAPFAEARPNVSVGARTSAVVIGGPAREPRRRVDDGSVDALPRLAWRDWTAERVAAGSRAIRGADLAALAGLAP